MYVVDNSARKATITLTGEEVAVKFPCTYSVFGIKGDNMLLYPKSGMAQGDDGVYDTAEGDDSVIMCLHYQAETVYIKGTGSCVIWAGNSTLDNPFSSTGKGGGGSGGDNTHYKGTTTTAISNGSTTNPITIDGKSYTAVFGDIVVYNYTEFVFDGTAWGEFGRPFDTTPTSGSANAVTSDGIKTALDTKQNIMQYTTMPTITASMLGKVVQYVGATDSNYKQGWNYVAVSDGEAEPTYSWQELTVGKIGYVDTPEYEWDVPANGEVFNDYEHNTATAKGAHAEGISSEATAKGAHAEGMYSRATGEGAHAESQSIAAAPHSHAHGAGNVRSTGICATAMGRYASAQAPNSTVVGTCNKTYDTSQGETIPDLLFVVGNGRMLNPPQPPRFIEESNILEVDYTSLNVNGDIQRDGVGIDDYTTTERKIGKWIDGSDLYQRTFEVTTLVNDNQWHTDALGTSGIDIVDFGGYIDFNSGGSFADRQPLNTWISSNNYISMDSIKSDLEYRINRPDVTIEKAVITIKYTKPSVQALNANLIPSDNPFNVSVMESSETPTSNEEPTDEMR